MTKVIRSQCGQKLQYVPPCTPFYFNIAPEIVDGEKEGEKITIYSVGIGSVSFGIFCKNEKAIAAMDALENFLLDQSLRFQMPTDE